MEPGVAIGPSRKPEQQMFLKTYVKRVVLVAAKRDRSPFVGRV